MKKLLLVISFIIPLLFTSFNNVIVRGEEVSNVEECEGTSKASVRIIDNYNIFKGNGFVYEVDEKYTYVVASSRIISESNNFGVIYENGIYKDALIVGYDNYNEVVVFKTDKVNSVSKVCLGNSDYLYRGQKNYVYGYMDKETKMYRSAYLGGVGDLYYSKNNIRIYKSVIDINGSELLVGSGVFDVEDRLIGMISSYDSRLEGSSYIVESNKLMKIVDSIVKTGNYKVNYIKYSIEDYSSLSGRVREFYGVSSKASSGVVVTTFKPLNYIFGGLNQGMTIVAVNGIEISNAYEFDKQISGYKKKSKVCLKVIKKNGKEAFYFVKV